MIRARLRSFGATWRSTTKHPTNRQAKQEMRDYECYRWWVRIYNEPVSDHTTLNDLEPVIQPGMLHRINDHVIMLAHEDRLTRGYRLWGIRVRPKATSIIRPTAVC